MGNAERKNRETNMETIRLSKGSWEIDLGQQLGLKGGFGAVYAGTKEGFPPLAIKRLDITSQDSAHRELRIAEELSGRELKYIVPIFDSGQDAESDFYYIVMARAERSLREELQRRGHFEEIDAAKVLLEIVAGIEEVSNLVHRDLKPENVLCHEGVWKIADFGIAKFVEESTSLRTLKASLTPQYAAPEQWELGKATTATDLYALGCIAYELLSGNTPFRANTFAEYQQQHLHSEPPPLETKSPLLRTLISMLLRKNPEGRPSIERVRVILEDIISNTSSSVSSSGLNELAQAGAIQAERDAAIEAKARVEEAEQQGRQKLAQEAIRILYDILGESWKRIVLASPSAISERNNIRLGNALLEINPMNGIEAFPKDSFSNCKWDVISGAFIQVVQANPQYTWSGNLWYTNLGIGASYRWYETSYFHHNGSQFAPFFLTNLNDADLAHSNIMHIYHVAATPKPIDGENIGDFVDRWSELLAKAFKGELSYPRYLPID